MPIFRFSLYAGAALIIVGILLYLFDNPRGILGNIDIESRQDITAYAVAKNASTKYYDEKGELSYSVESLKLSHFRPESDDESSYTIAEKPRIQVFQNEKPWRISADTGRVSNDRIITLSSNVVLIGRGANNELTEMLTSKLIYDPSQKLASTDEAVTILSPLGEITARGMIADISERKIKLLNDVKGQHRPETLER